MYAAPCVGLLRHNGSPKPPNALGVGQFFGTATALITDVCHTADECGWVLWEPRERPASPASIPSSASADTMKDCSWSDSPPYASPPSHETDPLRESTRGGAVTLRHRKIHTSHDGWSNNTVMTHHLLLGDSSPASEMYPERGTHVRGSDGLSADALLTDAYKLEERRAELALVLV